MRAAPRLEDAPDMDRLRERIEQVDAELVQLVAERVRLARRIGSVKHRAGLATLDTAREAAVVRRAAALARDTGLDVEPVRDLFWLLIGLCRRAQTDDG